MLKNCTLLLLLVVLLSACGSLKNSPKYQLSDGKYEFKQGRGQYEKALVYVKEDTLSIFLESRPGEFLNPEPLQDQFFIKRSFDIDVITVPFKYRPVTAGLPRQLTTDFNGNLFVGYRIDRFRLIHKQTPVGWQKIYRHRALSAGAFGGLGSTNVSPSTTSNNITDDYSGLVLSRGLALMVGINNLTVGLGIGWDNLTDRDKSVWIYQNKPWYGLTLGLNLN